MVTTVIKELGLDKYSVPFNESTNPLFYLRTKNMYLNDITSASPAPYYVDHYGADDSPDTGFNTVESARPGRRRHLPQTRAAWCEFYQNGTHRRWTCRESSVFQKGERFTDIGYWNLMFDQLGSEGFGYVADGNGYTSNVINWNSAVALAGQQRIHAGHRIQDADRRLFQHVHRAVRGDREAREDEGREVRLSPRHAAAFHPADRGRDPLHHRDAQAAGQEIGDEDDRCRLAGDAALRHRPGGAGDALSGARRARRAEPRESAALSGVGDHAAVLQGRHVLRHRMVDRYDQLGAAVSGADRQLRGHAGGARRAGEGRASRRSYLARDQEGSGDHRNAVRLGVELHHGRGAHASRSG